MAKGWTAAGIGAGSRSREAADVQLKKVGFKAFERSFSEFADWVVAIGALECKTGPQDNSEVSETLKSSNAQTM
jgi:hypothetical protein